MGINNTNKIQKKINKLFSFLMIKYKEVKGEQRVQNKQNNYLKRTDYS